MYEKAKETKEDPNCESDTGAIMELRRAQEAFHYEMEVSQRVTAFTLEEINMGTVEEPRPISIAKDLSPPHKVAMIDLLLEYKEVFA